jgi:hypothetical protein
LCMRPGFNGREGGREGRREEGKKKKDKSALKHHKQPYLWVPLKLLT